ncbi:type IV pilus assembly protein PilM [Desulfospira joergensenii]|uniref:type IV pilus assembly protein PilM n=1 Tax=Desulfospira joergensenii TaxID=53329 RepID=UPI0003B3BCCA|nr:type IV pilus assembly protein PilM [Desulfospira joergensenii]
MILGGKKHLIGLDIGSSFVKAAEVKISSKGNVLKKFGMAKIPYGAIAEDRIVDMDGVAEVIRTLLKTHKIREKNVAISTGGHSVVIKTINTSKQPENELHKTIYSEAEQYIPYDIDDVNIDYQILGGSEFSPEQMNVLLVAVKKDLVAEYIELIQTAGLNPKIIDVDTFALQNIYEALPHREPEEIAMLVDVGASKTSLNILKGTNSIMMRDNVSGTNQIVEGLSSRLEISVQDAENMLAQGNGEEGDLIREISADISNTWCSEICEVINAFQNNTNEEKLGKILLSGGGSLVKGFAENLQSEVDARVAVLDPFGGLVLDSKKFPDSFITKVGPQAPIALGLALRRVDDK